MKYVQITCETMHWCVCVCVSIHARKLLHLPVTGLSHENGCIMANQSRNMQLVTRATARFSTTLLLSCDMMGMHIQGCSCGTFENPPGRAVLTSSQHNSKTWVSRLRDRCFATEHLIEVENRLTTPQVRSLSRSHREYTPQRMAQLAATGTRKPVRQFG